jgi:transcription elongation factor Elf1
MKKNYSCPVCGFPNLTEAPRTRTGGGSFEICPSCGFQFGVSDDDRGFTYTAWLEKWRAEGMKWSSKQKPPRDWDPIRQIGILPRRKH